METLPGRADEECAHPAPREFRPPVAVAVAVLSVSPRELIAFLCPPAPADAGQWSLPSWTLCPGDTLEGAARSELGRWLGMGGAYLEQLYTVEVDQDGTERLLEVGYLALVPGAGAEPGSGGDSASPGWLPAAALPPLPPDHTRIMGLALRRLRRKLSDTDIARHLLPREFSLSELQQVYEVVQDRHLDKRNFRKWILSTGLVEATLRERREGAHRPARLYRFRNLPLPPAD